MGRKQVVKRRALAAAVVVAGLSAAVSGCASTNGWARAEMGGVPIVVRESDDIGGASSVYRYNLQDVPSAGVMRAADTVMLGYVDPAGKAGFFFLGVDYVGESWRFMEGEIVFEIDGEEVYIAEDRSPVRETRGPGLVMERVWAPLPEGGAAAIRNASTMRMQYWSDAFEIAQEDLDHMQAFISSVRDGAVVEERGR